MRTFARIPALIGMGLKEPKGRQRDEGTEGPAEGCADRQRQIEIRCFEHSDRLDSCIPSTPHPRRHNLLLNDTDGRQSLPVVHIQCFRL